MVNLIIITDWGGEAHGIWARLYTIGPSGRMWLLLRLRQLCRKGWLSQRWRRESHLQATLRTCMLKSTKARLGGPFFIEYKKPRPLVQTKIPPWGFRAPWLCLRLYCAELSVQFGAKISPFYILNIEYRTRNFEQQKFLKAVRQCFLLRYSAVPCSAVHILNDVIADSWTLNTNQGEGIWWYLGLDSLLWLEH